jgi:hypothetical protein
MRVRVETRPERHGEETPHRVRFDGREVGITEVLDQWPGADYRYFKIRGDDGNTYILRLHEPRGEWELTMFQTPTASA